MVRFKTILFFSLVSTSLAFADSASFNPSQQTKILGRALGGDVQAGVPDNTSQVQTIANLKVFGKSMQGVKAVATPPTDVTGVGQAEFYSFGKRIFSQSGYFTHDGIFGATAGMIPTEIRIPAFVYPVGPLLLQVDAGVRFQADVTAQMSPTVMIPVNLSTLLVDLSANAQAAGFVEGYANLYAIRGGLGGQVDVLDGKLDVKSQFYFNGNRPWFKVSGLVEFLRGRFYAFADFLNIFKFGWSRFWDATLYGWKGYCFSTGDLSCSSQ